MIREETRSHMSVEVNGRSLTIPGEMFFPPGGKIGFAIYTHEVKYRDRPRGLKISSPELDAVISGIRSDLRGPETSWGWYERSSSISPNPVHGTVTSGHLISVEVQLPRTVRPERRPQGRSRRGCGRGSFDFAR